MPSTEEIYSSYVNVSMIKARGLVGVPLKVTHAEAQDVGQGERAKVRVVLSLERLDKTWPLNSTNAHILIGAWGDDYSLWVGRALKINIAKVKFQGNYVDGLVAEPVVEPVGESPAAPTGDQIVLQTKTLI